MYIICTVEFLERNATLDALLRIKPIDIRIVPDTWNAGKSEFNRPYRQPTIPTPFSVLIPSKS